MKQLTKDIFILSLILFSASNILADKFDKFEKVNKFNKVNQFELVDMGSFDEASLKSNDTLFAPSVDPERFSIFGGIGAWAGDVTYQIGGTVKYPDGQEIEVNDPLSELKWPLGVAMLSLGWRSCFWERIEIFQDIMLSISDPSGKMEDSDWGDSQNPNDKNIYSESDTKLKASSLDTGVRIWLMNFRMGRQGTIDIGLGAGLLLQNMEWKTTVTEQWYMGEQSTFNYAGSYTAKLMMPYLDLAGKMHLKSFRLLTEIGLTPWVEVKDDDHHILRYKKSTTEATGYGLKGRVEGRYYLTENLFVNAEVKAIYYKADGMDKSYFYAGEYSGLQYEIDHTIESRQFNGTLGIGLAF